VSSCKHSNDQLDKVREKEIIKKQTFSPCNKEQLNTKPAWRVKAVDLEPWEAQIH
jgi:hypothetical protein